MKLHLDKKNEQLLLLLFANDPQEYRSFMARSLITFKKRLDTSKATRSCSKVFNISNGVTMKLVSYRGYGHDTNKWQDVYVSMSIPNLPTFISLKNKDVSTIVEEFSRKEFEQAFYKAPSE